MVIPNEKDMDDFIRLLNYSLNTIDGIKDTANLLYKRLSSLPSHQKKRMNLVEQGENYKLRALRVAQFRFTLMKIRTKISYMAFVK